MCGYKYIHQYELRCSEGTVLLLIKGLELETLDSIWRTFY